MGLRWGWIATCDSLRLLLPGQRRLVLSLKLVKSYDLGIAEMGASPTFKCLLCL